MRLFHTLQIVCIGLVLASSSTSCKRQTMTTALSPVDATELRVAVKTATGVDINASYTILSQHRDHNRLNGLEEWVFYTDRPIDPKSINSGAKWLDRSILDGLTELVAHRIRPRQVGKAIRGFSADWKENNREVTASILETDSGSYLILLVAPF